MSCFASRDCVLSRKNLAMHSRQHPEGFVRSLVLNRKKHKNAKHIFQEFDLEIKIPQTYETDRYYVGAHFFNMLYSFA